MIIYDQFHTLQQELKIVYDKYDAPFIYESAYTSKFQYNQTYRLREIDAKHIAVVDMLYLIVFFGVGRTGRQAIEEHTNGRYNKAFVSEMIEMAALKPKLESDIYDRWQEVYESSDREEKAKRQIMANQAAQKIKKIREAEPHLQPAISYLEADGVYSSEYSKFYGGHQFRLAHYFRHLYQTVSYIHHSEIDKQQKEEYIRHLRGQLSNNEQITIFLNSLSQMGRSWELETKKDGKMIQPAHQFISKYHLIKNISVNEVMPGIKLSDYYPEINYDAFEKEP
ncbi:MAG: hypothetical protein EOO20_03675 [Chryseobacterium sp.]|nr:MAG: hypothetical protein EOO20_03675 [Chryseobacterium sp.]